MGTEAAWVPLVIAAAGAATQAGNQYYTQKRQEEIAQRNNMTQQRKQHEADARINEGIAKIGRSDGEAERQASWQGFIDQLKAQDSNVKGLPPTAGGKRFMEDTTTAQAAVQNFGKGRADMLSRVTAPNVQRRNERVVAARMGDDVSGIGREAAGWDQINRMRIQNTRANPWIDALGKTMVAAGMAGMGGGVGGGGELSPIEITAQRIPVPGPIVI